MADKRIDELTAASALGDSDLLVIEQSSTAKKLTGSMIKTYIGTIPSTAADVGAIAAPSSPTSGQFLQYNGSAWVAASLPTYNGGVS